MKNILFSIIIGIAGAAVTFLVCMVIFTDYLFEVMGITSFLCVTIAVIVGVYCAKKNLAINSFKLTILYTAILCIIMCTIGGFIDKSRDPSYSYVDNGLTQQEKDNLDFYNQMEDAWNNYRDNN